MLHFLLLLACEPTISTSKNDAETPRLDQQVTDVVPSLDPLSPIESSPSEVSQESESASTENHDAESDSQDEASAEEGSSVDSTDSEQASWTVMVFVNGDSDLEGAGLDDLNEMEMIGSSEEVNVIVQFDRSADFTTDDGDWSGARRYRITQDEDSAHVSSSVLEELGEVDSGDYHTVVDFVAWTTQQYPADKYALVLWNHGNGWRMKSTSAAVSKDISVDYSSGNSISVANGDLQALLEESTELLGQRFEVVGMDACLMQTWEVATVVAPFANYLTASQDLEGFDGWDYTGLLADLVDDPDMDGAGFGDAAAYHFYQSGDLTQSVLELSHMSTVNDALDDLAAVMLANPEPELYYASVEQAFAGYWGMVDEHDLVGMVEYLYNHSEDQDVVYAAERLLEQLDELIIENYTNNSVGAHGLSIYAPGVDSWYDSSYAQGAWATEHQWNSLLTSVLGH